MKLIGVVFIVISAGTVGFRLARQLRLRCTMLRQLQSALHVLKNEIAFCATPVPRAFAKMAASLEGALAELFARASGAMDKRCWLTPSSAMEYAMQEVPGFEQGDKVRDILLELAGKLGQYDLDSQIQGIGLAMTQLDEERQAAERERSVKSKTYETLGVCAGLAVAILLL